MVLIFSIDGDQSTNDVIDWLHYKEVSFMRLNSDDVYFAGSFPSIYLNNRIEKNGESTILKKVKSIWFRRGLQLSGGKGSSYMELGDNIRRIVINKGINNEYKALSSFYFDTFSRKNVANFS